MPYNPVTVVGFVAYRQDRFLFMSCVDDNKNINRTMDFSTAIRYNDSYCISLCLQLPCFWYGAGK